MNTSISNWGNASSYGYDGLSRPSSFAHDFAGTSDDTSTTLSYNAANQITSAVRSNDAFAWTGQAALNRNYTSNGLNEYSNVGGTSYGYDGNHNLTSDGTNSYVYDVENQLVSRSGGGTTATVRYDPLGRLYEVVGSVTGTTRFLYDGDDLVAEYDGSGTLLRRYAHGEGVDQPLVQFEGSGVSDSARRYFYSDERGSIIAVTDGAGNVLNRMAYDEYGLPQESNSSYRSRFQYTGQAWIPELGMNYYKARMYSPLLGRFMQTDPIGYGDGMNMYAYVKNDPVNNADPTGLDGASFVYATCSQLAAGAATAGMNSEDFMRRHASCFGPQLYALDQQRLANEAWLRGNVQGGSPSDGFAAAAGQQTPQNGKTPEKPKLPYDRTPGPGQTVNGCTGVPNIFVRSCNAHDVCYQTPTPRVQCDGEFLQNMMAEHPEFYEKQRNPATLNAYTVPLNAADVYAIGVRLFGWLFYTGKPEGGP